MEDIIGKVSATEREREVGKTSAENISKGYGVL